MSNPDRDAFYGGLLGKLAFNVDMQAEGRTQEETDALWIARFPAPEEPSNVVYGIDFTRGKPDPEAA